MTDNVIGKSRANPVMKFGVLPLDLSALVETWPPFGIMLPLLSWRHVILRRAVSIRIIFVGAGPANRLGQPLPYLRRTWDFTSNPYLNIAFSHESTTGVAG
jgi:hypothetical protein